MSNTQATLYEVRDGAAWITLNRPENRNALSAVLVDELYAHLQAAQADPAARCIVLTGNGPAFCAGADLKNPPGSSTEGKTSVGLPEVLGAMLDSPKPVIAAVNGAAIGAGCVLALCCDIVLVAEDAFLSMTEVDVGLAGGVRHVLRHFGQSDARLMIYTARRITGPELLRMNVASLCLPREGLLAAAQQIGREIAEKVPLAVQAAKRSFQVVEYMPLHEGYRFEQGQTAALSRTEDTQEAWRAFAEKRKPVFKGR